MDPIILTIIGVGVAGVVTLGTQSWQYNSHTKDSLKQISGRIDKLDNRFDKLENKVNEVDKQMGRLDGLLRGLQEAITGSRVA